MLSLDYVKELDIRVRKLIDAYKALQTENAALVHRVETLTAEINQLTNESQDYRSGDAELKTQLHEVLSVLEELESAQGSSEAEDKDKTAQTEIQAAEEKNAQSKGKEQDEKPAAAGSESAEQSLAFSEPEPATEEPVAEETAAAPEASAEPASAEEPLSPPPTEENAEIIPAVGPDEAAGGIDLLEEELDDHPEDVDLDAEINDTQEEASQSEFDIF